MYNYVKEILDISKNKDVDISFAKDRLLAEKPTEKELILTAYECIDDYYNYITKFRRDNDEESIIQLCELVESNDNIALSKFLDDIK